MSDKTPHDFHFEEWYSSGCDKNPSYLIISDDLFRPPFLVKSEVNSVQDVSQNPHNDINTSFVWSTIFSGSSSKAALGTGPFSKVL
jgi:hypothetical protein